MRLERVGNAVIFRYSKSEEKQFVGNLLKSINERLKLLEERMDRIERLLSTTKESGK